jgi:hypothetical protein
MKHPKDKKSKRSTIAYAIGITVGLSIATNASAFSMPTIDATAIMRLAEQNQTLSNQLTQMTDMTKLAEDQLSVLGEFGVMGDLFGSSGFSSIGSQAEFYDNMKKFAFDPCSINLCQVGDNPIGTTDIEEAMAWAKSNFYSNKQLDHPEIRDLNEVRRRAVVYATTNGLALATIVHNELAGAGEEADALEQIVESSQNLRGDVRANSAIALATYKIEIEKLAILTAMLNIEATSSMQITDIYHEEGGEKFPDAFIDSDYTGMDFSTRTRVTIPEKKDGTPASTSE